MANKSQGRDADLIRLRDYVMGRLALARRYLSIRRNIKRISRLNQENRESWGSLLEQNAEKYPHNPAVKSEESSLTYKEYNEAVNRCAHYFISQGLKKGDTVIVFVENRTDLLIIYSAIAKIGAINCMINTNLREKSLLHCLTLNPGKAFVVGEEVIDAFANVRAELKPGGNQRLYHLSDSGQRPAPDGFVDLKEEATGFPAINPPTTAGVGPKDVLAYVFTSGTTGGMPKAAVITHRRAVSCTYFTGKIVMNIMPTDTIYVPLPFFHTNALALSWPCIFANGAALAIRRKFSAGKFWDDVRKFDATIFCYVGECCRYLMNQPPRPDDSMNPLKAIIGNGLRPDIWREFKERFGIEKIFEIYGGAESNIFFINILNLDCTVGTSFTPFAIVKYDIDADEPIRDENGFMQKVKVGETGLVLGEITEISPFAGYTSKKTTEAKVFRDVFTKGDAWFNSGDLMRDIGFRHAQFVDRLGDTFRWKGENVSTTEVEKIANAFPRISMSAVYGVVMPGAEGRVGMAAIIAETEPDSFDFKGLAEHFQKALPAYAIPRFIRFKTDFEYTPTHKIKKVNAKKEGFDPGIVADPLYVLLPGDSAYTPLTKDLYEDILDWKYKF